MRRIFIAVILSVFLGACSFAHYTKALLQDDQHACVRSEDYPLFDLLAAIGVFYLHFTSSETSPVGGSGGAVVGSLFFSSSVFGYGANTLCNLADMHDTQEEED